MSVLVLAPYPLRSAPSQRFRFEQYLPALRERGIEVDVRPLLTAAEWQTVSRPGHAAAKARAVARGGFSRLADVARARRYDLVLVHREAFPLGYPFIERGLAALGAPYLFDFDDAIYLRNASDANRALARLKFPGKTATLVRHAALTVAGNSHLANWASARSDAVEVIPTTIDTDAYRPRGPSRDGPICVGWSGSRTSSLYLLRLRPLLRDVQVEFGVRLRVIGNADFDIPGAEVEASDWREDSELDDLAEIGIGLMPLPDDAWSRGKCGLKALQYMALGIPTIMSPVGMNPEIAEGGAARLAGCDEEWRKALVELIESPASREAYAAAGRRRVEERYSTERNLEKWVDALFRAAGRERRASAP